MDIVIITIVHYRNPNPQKKLANTSCEEHEDCESGYCAGGKCQYTKQSLSFYDLENKNWSTYSNKYTCNTHNECKDYCIFFKENSDGNEIKYCVESLYENNYAINLPIGAPCKPKEDYDEEVQCGNTSSSDNWSQYNLICSPDRNICVKKEEQISKPYNYKKCNSSHQCAFECVNWEDWSPTGFLTQSFDNYDGVCSNKPRVKEVCSPNGDDDTCKIDRLGTDLFCAQYAEGEYKCGTETGDIEFVSFSEWVKNLDIGDGCYYDGQCRSGWCAHFSANRDSGNINAYTCANKSKSGEICDPGGDDDTCEGNLKCAKTTINNSNGDTIYKCCRFLK